MKILTTMSLNNKIGVGNPNGNNGDFVIEHTQKTLIYCCKIMIKFKHLTYLRDLKWNPSNKTLLLINVFWC